MLKAEARRRQSWRWWSRKTKGHQKKLAKLKMKRGKLKSGKLKRGKLKSGKLKSGKLKTAEECDWVVQMCLTR